MTRALSLIFCILAATIQLSIQQAPPCLSSPCAHGTACFDDLGGYTCACEPGYMGTRCDEEVPEPCFDTPCVYGTPCFKGKGVYQCNCYPGFYGDRCENSVNKLCSEISNRPYPILIQQHFYASTFFMKSWDEMLVEQGSPTGDYWIGLRELRQILAEGQGRFRLRVDMVDYEWKHWRSSYDTFMIDTEYNNFTLTVKQGMGAGNISSQLTVYNGMKFSTYDRDNAPPSTRNLAEYLGGAFWHYTSTCYACLNGSPVANFKWNPGIPQLISTAMYLECKSEGLPGEI